MSKDQASFTKCFQNHVEIYRPARPLGVSCNMDSMPIVVGELPQGEAYTAGVREGWVLCQVGNDPSNMR